MFGLRTAPLRLAVVAVIASVVAGCSGSGDSSANRETVRRDHTIRSCGAVQCSGEIDGARYEARLPKKWNGTLLIFSHGYRQTDPSPPDFAPIATDAAVAPSEASAKQLVDQGYALVGSAYSSNGWAYKEGVRAGEQLYAWFRKSVAEPDRVYVWGESLGGLITQGIAEKHPEWVTGVAPMCGVLGGVNLNLDLALDLAYAVKMLLYPEMKLTGYTSRDEAVRTWTEAQKRIMAAVKDVKTAAPKLLAIQALLDGPTKTSRFDGHTVTSQASAVVESALTGLLYGTVGRWDIEQRVGGNPSGNASVDYRGRVSDSERKLAAAVSAGGLEPALKVLDSGARITADPEARRRAQDLGDPTGALKDPTITLHTGYDPLVLVQNERVFAERAEQAEGRTADLVQLFTEPPQAFSTAPYGAGHCNFTDGESVGLIKLLDDWVTKDVFPSPSVAKEGIKGATGLAADFMPGPWPAYATP